MISILVTSSQIPLLAIEYTVTIELVDGKLRDQRKKRAQEAARHRRDLSHDHESG